MRFRQRDGGLDDLAVGALAEEVAKRLVAAQFLVVETIDAQRERQQQHARAVIDVGPGAG